MSKKKIKELLDEISAKTGYEGSSLKDFVICTWIVGVTKRLSHFGTVYNWQYDESRMPSLDRWDEIDEFRYYLFDPDELSVLLNLATADIKNNEDAIEFRRIVADYFTEEGRHKVNIQSLEVLITK